MSKQCQKCGEITDMPYHTCKRELDCPHSTGSLFRVIVLHGAPKDSHKSTETYLVAESEEAVCEWINKEKQCGCWFDEDDYEKEIPFREWVMLKRGDLEDEAGWEDAYYGVTKWGWEPIEASADDIAILLRLGIAHTANNKEH